MGDKEYAVFGKTGKGKLVKKYVMATDKIKALEKANKEYGGDGTYFTFAKIRKGCSCG